MNLAAFLVSHKVYFEFLEKRSTHHAQEAALATGVDLSQIVKSIVFLDQDAKPLLAVVQGDRNVSRHKLERCSGSKSVRVAAAEIAEQVTGYPTGGIPPVGLKKKLPVFIDQGVMRQEYVWCGGGARTKLVKLRTEDIARLSDATVCDISISDQ